MKGTWMAAGAAVLGTLAAAGQAIETAEPRKPAVEVVFVLDTTSSMGGLIEGAKQKIWAIANEIAKGKPSPRIKMGIVAYRDRGDAYVTQTFDLTSNLDKMYQNLLSLKAEGGGDGPEHVLKGLEDAVERMSWSTDPRTFKVVYLVGDAPPHREYGDTPTMEALLQRAVRKGLIVNAVQCGTWAETTPVWQTVARLAEGKFLAIAQDGGMAAVSTPFDERIGRLSGRLDGTVLAYGARKAEARAELALSSFIGAAASAPAAAERAAYRGKAGFESEKDLVTAVEQNKVGLDKLKNEELPDELRGLSKEKREAKVREITVERRKIQKELESLNADRARFLAAQAGAGKKDSFDAALVDSLKEQATRKGIAY